MYLAPYIIPGEKSWREYDDELYALAVGDMISSTTSNFTENDDELFALAVGAYQFYWDEKLHIRGRKPSRGSH